MGSLEGRMENILVLVEEIVLAWFIYSGVVGELFLYWFWYRITADHPVFFSQVHLAFLRAASGLAAG